MTTELLTELLLVQLLVLGATAVLFWLARRDLRPRVHSAPMTPPDTQELEQLCVTLESLVVELSGRLDRLERQTAQAAPNSGGARGEPLPARSSPPSPKRRGEEGKTSPVAEVKAPPVADDVLSEPPPPPVPALAGPEGGGPPLAAGWVPAPPPLPTGGPALDVRYASIYALLDAGITDPQEITRRVGLSRGEVDLILSLRDRRAL